MIAPATLNHSLTLLSDTAMIRRLDEVEPAYMIKHALVQDTAQATLLKNESKFLHGKVGIALEQVNAARLDDYAAELAHHFSQAEEESKCFEYSLLAGDVAARVFANQEALEHYARAIKLGSRGIATSPQLIELFTRRGRILEVTGKYHEALATYLELHELAEQRGDRSLELASLMLRAPVHSAPLPTFDAELARQLLLDALGTARELRDEPAEARVLWNLALLAAQTLRPADGVMYGELALDIAERLKLREQQGYTLHDLFVPYRATGQVTRAREVQQQARAIFRETGNQSMLADNLGMSAQITAFEGDIARALEYAREGLAISRAIDNPFGMGFNSLIASIVHLERGENAAVLDEIHERNALIENSPPGMSAGWIASIHSWFCAVMGAFAESSQMEQRARQYDELLTPPIFRSGQNGLLARARILQNDLDSAAAHLARGTVDLDLENALQPGTIHVPFARAELTLARGEYAQALVELPEQGEWLRANEYFLVLTENLLLQGRAYLGLDDAPQARVVLEEARILVGPIGSRRLEYQILAALAAAEYRCGNKTQADLHRARARATVEYIVKQTPPGYRAGLLGLSLIREVMD